MMNQSEYYERFLQNKTGQQIAIDENATCRERDLIVQINNLLYEVEWLRQQLAWQQQLFEPLFLRNIMGGTE